MHEGHGGVSLLFVANEQTISAMVITIYYCVSGVTMVVEKHSAALQHAGWREPGGWERGSGDGNHMLRPACSPCNFVQQLLSECLEFLVQS